MEKLLSIVIETFGREFTWSKAGLALTFLLIALLGLYGYESYTSAFYHARLERETSLLGRTIELSAKLDSLPPTAVGREEMRKSITSLAGSIHGPVSAFEPLNLVPHGWTGIPRTAYISLPWLILALIVFLGSTSDRGSSLLGLLIVATPIVLIVANLPLTEWAWVNYHVYAWGPFVLVMLVLWLRIRSVSSST